MMRTMVWSPIVGLLWYWLIGSCQAQTAVMIVGGPASSQIGYSSAPAGDINLDGVPDFLAGSPHLSVTGELVVAFSGEDGSMIHVIHTPAADIGFGWAVDGGQDVDGDGVPDILIGAPYGGPLGPGLGDGSAHVYSGATGTQIRVHVGDFLDALGFNVGFVGDVNSDGCAEYAAAAPRSSFFSPGSKQVRVFDGAAGLTKAAWTSSMSSGFGWSIQRLGDVDGDGVVDLAVGDPIATDSSFQGGRVHVYSMGTLTELYRLTGSANFDSYGFGIAAPGDYDKDGFADVATTQFGGLRVFSGKPAGGGQPKLGELFHPCLCYFGTAGGFPGGKSLGAISDFDDDGTPEFVVGVKPQAFPDFSASYIASAAKNQLLMHVGEPPPVVHQVFPDQVFSVGDLDGDGLGEWAMAGSGKAMNLGTANGFVGIYSGRPLYAHQESVDSTSNYRVEFDLNAGLPRAGNQYILLAGATGTSPGVPVKSQIMPLNFDFLTDISIAFANLGPFETTLGTLDSFGKAEATFDGATLPPVAIGLKLAFAYYTVGPVGLYVSTNAVEIPILGVPGAGL